MTARVLSIVGARPQFIKVAVLSRALEASTGIEHVIIHTGQHYDDLMSDRFFDELEIPHPALNLGVGSGTHGSQTGKMLVGLEPVLEELRPTWVVVYGDTNSTLAGALAAAKLNLRVAHIEAGLRSFNRRMPEEVNRVVTDHLSELLFAPTAAAVENLRREGIPEDRIHLVGDVMHDAVLYYQAKAEWTSDVLRRLDLEAGNYVLATVHRAENTDAPDRLRGIITGLDRVARELPVVLPAHPRTRAALQRTGLLSLASSRIRLTDPVGYLDMLLLEKHARVIATDSGGVQKEAFLAGRPCVTLRDETEWVELVEADANTLAGADPVRIAEAILERCTRGIPPDRRPGGIGDAGRRIAEVLLSQ
jgi:UDP-GlcNAc3NAcA epimerase